MTKYDSTVKNFVDEWYKLRDTMSREDYNMLQGFAKEVLK